MSDGEDLSTTQLLRRLSRALGKPARLLNFPEGLLKLAAAMLGKQVIAQRLCGSLQVDISKIFIYWGGRHPSTWTKPCFRPLAIIRNYKEMTVWWLLLLVIVASWGLTFILRRYALVKSLIDIPNERSSHTVPTPRGGGVAIVASFLLALPVLTSLGLLDLAALVGLFGSGLLVAVIGFADDHGHIAARWRLLGHFVAAAWALYWLNGLPAVDFFGVAFDLGLVGNALAAVYLVWMLNLYNFMDGIDGLASAEAISACFAMCVVYWLSGQVELIWLALFLTGAVSGFTYWNIPPARIFMGDAGSGFLGITLGVFVLHAASVASELLWSWIIILGVLLLTPHSR